MVLNQRIGGIHILLHGVCVLLGDQGFTLAGGIGGVSVGTWILVVYVVVPILAHALRGNTLPPWWLRFKVPP